MTIQSIQRAVTILRSFTEAEPELRVTDLSHRLGLHKSTVSRILSTLQIEGLVAKNEETGRYRLGVGLVSLAGVALGRLDVRGLSQPHLNALVDLSEETVNVTVLDGHECVNIERAASPKSIRYVGWIGRRTPLHCTASGKLFLAYISPEERRRLLAQPLVKYTEKSIIDSKLLERSLRKIREQGFAIVHQEFEEGFSAIAAPIFDHTGKIVATISISGPSFRMGDETVVDYIEPLQEITWQISGELGYS